MSKIQMPATTSFRNGFDEFIELKRMEGCRDITITHYINSIHVFTLFHDPDTPIENISQNDLFSYHKWLKDRGVNDVTIRTYFRDLRAVLNYFFKQEYLERFDIIVPKATAPKKIVYTDDDLRKLLKKPKKGCTFTEYRDWTVINYILGTGQRLRTILELRNGDIDSQNRLVFLRHLKNRSQTILPLTKSLVSILAEYMRIRGGCSDDHLFCTCYGKKLSSSGLISSIRLYNKSRGVDKTSIHLLRHTFATKWISNSGDIYKLQQMLTHRDLRSTQIYINTDTEYLAADMPKINPLETLKMAERIKL